MDNSRSFDVYRDIPIAFEESDESKPRPVVVIGNSPESVGFLLVLPTYSYKDRFEHVPYTNFLCEIKDLESAGLSVRSYVNVSEVFEFPFTRIKELRCTGFLSDDDKFNLINLYNEYHSS